MNSRPIGMAARGLLLATTLCCAAPFCAAPASGGSAAATPTTRLDRATARQIDAQVAQVMQRFAVPGAAVAVLHNGTLVYAQGYGLRDRERRLPVRTDTPFEIGSITKQFTAAAIVQLQEAGKLKLDDTLATYLPDAPHAGEVTLRQLLSHTSGLHEYFDGPEQEVDRLITQPASYEQIVTRIAGLPLDFAPGTRWSYSNTGYLLLGKVIEKVSGEPYRQYLQRHLLDPLGMAHTFTLADTARLPGMAVGYRHEAGTLKRSPYFHPDWSGPAGFLVSTLDDLARWDAGLSNGTIVSSAGYAEMTRSVSTADGKPADYGLGLFVNTVYGQPRIGHTGGSQGFTTADEYFPAQKLRIIAFTNLGDKSPEPGITLTNAVFAALQPQQVAAWEQPVAGERTDVTTNARASFQQLQAGTGYGAFSASLGQRLTAGLGAGLSRSLRGYGAPTRMVFKGDRQGERGTLHDYVAEFGPGVFMPYTVRMDEDGKVVAFALD